MTAVERAYGAGLRRFLSNRLRRASSDAPDIFQEIFVRMLQIKDHETIRNPQAYLYTVASRVLHEFALKRSIGQETMDPLELASGVPSITASDPADEIANGGRRHTAPAQTRERRHTWIIPAFHLVAAHQLRKHTLR